jgi:pilus assembly protein Flp/PilA
VKRLKIYLQRMVAFIDDEDGVTVIENALLVALIALVVAGVATLIGNTISGMFSTTATKIDSTGP